MSAIGVAFIFVLGFGCGCGCCILLYKFASRFPTKAEILAQRDKE